MKYILIADDEPINQALIKDIFTDLYEFQTADNGSECLEKIQKRVPDLLLLDYSMPELNGLEVCEQLRKDTKTSQLPIIILSGYDSEAHISAAREAGADDYISKPYSPAKLIEVAEKLLGEA